LLALQLLAGSTAMAGRLIDSIAVVDPAQQG
jgi:hypothetical protein